MKGLLVILIVVLFVGVAPAQNLVVPIISKNVLIGGTRNTEWLTAKQTIALIPSEIDLFLVGEKGLQKNVIRGKTGAEDADFCVDTRIVEVDKYPDSIAIGAKVNWNPFPRIPAAISETNPTYQRIVADILRSKRINKPKVKITQIFKIDLDGDGTDEVLLTASNYRKGIHESQNAGDYSFFLLRKIVNGKPRNILIDGDFFTKRVEDAPPVTWEIELIADLNGDGKMEVWIEAYYYEGESNHIYELDQNRLKKVLEVDCGV